MKLFIILMVITALTAGAAVAQTVNFDHVKLIKL